MADDLADWWVHTVTVSPLAGSGAYGNTYGPQQPVTGFLDDSTRLVRDAAGAEVVSQSTFYTDVDLAGLFPPGSLVDVGTRITTVISAARRDAPGLGLPEHTEVTLS